MGSTLVTARQCDGSGSCSSPTLTGCAGYICDEAGVACRTNCTNDSHCQSGAFCEANQCKSKLGAGASCGRPGACQSGFCTDNKCCTTACTDLCETCADTPGTCTPLDGVYDGICSGELICKQGDCKALEGAYCNANTDCAHGNCVDNVCCDSPCTGACKQCRTGTCSDEQAGTTDAACAEGKACNGNAPGDCSTINGRACAVGSDCVSGICDNNICCGVACLGECQTCSLDGSTCVDVTGGDPDNGTCEAPRGCSEGECMLALGESCSGGTQCASGYCADATIAAGDVKVCCDEDCASACENCNPLTGHCEPIVLQEEPGCFDNTQWCDMDGNCTAAENSPCEDSGDCQVGFYCDVEKGECEAEHALGESCSANDECDSGFCANSEPGGPIANDKGVCCIAPCNGACDTCDNDGICELDLFNDPGACTNGDVCDGRGHCLAPQGTLCDNNDECATGYCMTEEGSGMDICAESLCDGLCEYIDAFGYCRARVGAADEGCQSPFICKARDVCLLELGQACGLDDSCASGICEDDMCCASTCAAGNHCSGGTCETDLPLGSNMCTVDAECASGFCINGICCANGCNSQPDRRCATCLPPGYTLCNLILGADTPDCNDGMTCNASAQCVPVVGTDANSIPAEPIPN